MERKVYPLEELAGICGQLRRDGKKIVQSHGCFDLVHPGHIKHFEAAKAMGDVLVVTLTEDAHVNKGPGRPIFKENLRAESVAALACVDYVAINRAATAVPAIGLLKPALYVKGQDYKNAADDITGEILNEKNAVEAHGGALAFTEEEQFSSSNLINEHLAFEEKTVLDYLKGLRKSLNYKHLEDRFEKIRNLNVLVIGDIILDEYQFVKPLGKASKSATITARMQESEVYAGGVLAVVNHIADFAGQVTLVSTYGDNRERSYLPFIKDNLLPNVTFKGIHTPERPTTLKRRFLDRTFKHKIFESIEIDDSPLPDDVRSRVMDAVRETMDAGVDLLVVADFGHGTMDRDLVDFVCGQKAYLAVNAQTNSANTGYNFLTKYPRCDYFSIDQEEARLACHDKAGHIRSIHERLMEKTSAGLGAITLGVDGSFVGNASGANAHAPVLSHEVVDSIGAGDAFLSVTSLLAATGADPGEIAFVGNAVGAMAVKILGNKTSIRKVPLLKYLKTLLA